MYFPDGVARHARCETATTPQGHEILVNNQLANLQVVTSIKLEGATSSLAFILSGVVDLGFSCQTHDTIYSLYALV